MEVGPINRERYDKCQMLDEARFTPTLELPGDAGGADRKRSQPFGDVLKRVDWFALILCS